MRFISYYARCLLIWRLLIQVSRLARGDDAFLDQVDLSESVQEEDSRKHQQGSWLHWWSYDGISGPDYWNINKRWQVCSWGRKQSPVELRTDRLVYDHLLTPIKLTWLTLDSNLQTSAATDSFMSSTNNIQQQRQQPAQDDSNNDEANNQKRPVKVQLLNSGRGIEAWLESHVGAGGLSLSRQQNQDQLILSHGPLSYVYKLFKIELHSASSYSSRNQRLPQSAALTEDAPSSHIDSRVSDASLENNQNNAFSKNNWGGSSTADEESVLETLRSGKSSEHLIDGRSFDGELQLHFYNKHLASSSMQALKMADDGSRSSLFATISVFLLTRQSSESDTNKKASPKTQRSSAIDFFLDNLAAIPDQGNTVELQLTRHHIESLVPDLEQYITYHGSLTRPPCTENVDWILVNRALRVDEEKFAGLFEKLNTNQDNIRPVKPLYRRQLRTTINNLNQWPRQRVVFGHHQESAKNKTNIECSSDEQSPLSSSNVAGERRRNCTIKEPYGSGETRQLQANSNGRHLKEGRHHTDGQCSMNPQYAYQLSFNKQEL